MEVPEYFYYLLGILIVSNIGTIGTVAFATMKGVWWLSKLDARVTIANKSAEEAHERIDELNCQLRNDLKEMYAKSR